MDILDFDSVTSSELIMQQTALVEVADGESQEANG